VEEFYQTATARKPKLVLILLTSHKGLLSYFSVSLMSNTDIKLELNGIAT
jgi:hypothetical protein